MQSQTNVFYMDSFYPIPKSTVKSAEGHIQERTTTSRLEVDYCDLAFPFSRAARGDQRTVNFCERYRVLGS